MKYAVIGTSWITRAFIGGIDLLPECYTLTAVYSREKSRGEEFLREVGKDAQIFTDLDLMAKSDNIDAVYIASPNSLHFEQALLMVQNGKHVIVEKPVVINEEQFMTLSDAASENNVIVLQTEMNTYETAVKVYEELK